MGDGDEKEGNLAAGRVFEGVDVGVQAVEIVGRKDVRVVGDAAGVDGDAVGADGRRRGGAAEGGDEQPEGQNDDADEEDKEPRGVQGVVGCEAEAGFSGHRRPTGASSYRRGWSGASR